MGPILINGLLDTEGKKEQILETKAGHNPQRNWHLYTVQTSEF